MCGIGLIFSGIGIRGYDAFPTSGASRASSQPSKELAETRRPNVEDLCGALKRRGPDHVGGAILHVWHLEQRIDLWSGQLPDDCAAEGRSRGVDHSKTMIEGNHNDEARQWKLESQPADLRQSNIAGCARIQFIGATLQLRGYHPVNQPLSDTVGNLLVYNGEIFGGLGVREDANDTVVIMAALNSCCGCTCHSAHQVSECSCSNLENHVTVPQVLSRLRGPWAIIFWQALSQTLWFGRDAIGRRSLLIHPPSHHDSRLLLSSVAPKVKGDKDGSQNYWQELACGIYSVACTAMVGLEAGDKPLRASGSQNGALSAEDVTLPPSGQEELGAWYKAHAWEDTSLTTLLAWERHHVSPCSLCSAGATSSGRVNHFTESFAKDAPDLDPRNSKDNCHVSFDSHHCHHQTGSHRSKGGERAWPHDQEQRTNCVTSAVEIVLTALRQAVKRRTIHIQRGNHQQQMYKSAGRELISGVKKAAPIAVLFSGGLDSMILAALADEFVAGDCSIDLLNVSFDGDSAPDRITAITGLTELQEVFPSRRWRLIEIDAELSALANIRNHLETLIYPSDTYMDLNIGTALWLAASGTGHVRHRTFSTAATVNDSNEDNLARTESGHMSDFVSGRRSATFGEESNGPSVAKGECTAVSEARVLLVGSGADEQCGGYGRHRTKFRLGGWEALDAEMRTDFKRIWKRNLGRDDRCIGDQGKEARFPFLDEEVVSTLLRLPLQDIVDLQQPPGMGDKKILRQVAQALGLKSAALLPKRAIQFGSRIAQESNRKDFGSNRAANQVSAGSASFKRSQMHELRLAES